MKCSPARPGHAAHAWTRRTHALWNLRSSSVEICSPPRRWEFPSDGSTIGISDQYMLGPKLLIAPVTVQGATRRKVYFPAGAQWLNFWNTSSPPLEGGITRIVDAPLEIIPAYYRV
mmetsp:Transcript_162/g.290  ORF Transcript_162/g.290 Transcript_162/m.290 type:complete len:116 (-) Transcript_162:9-356(-)